MFLSLSSPLSRTSRISVASRSLLTVVSKTVFRSPFVSDSSLPVSIVFRSFLLFSFAFLLGGECWFLSLFPSPVVSFPFPPASPLSPVIAPSVPASPTSPFRFLVCCPFRSTHYFERASARLFTVGLFDHTCFVLLPSLSRGSLLISFLVLSPVRISVSIGHCPAVRLWRVFLS